MTRLRKGTGDLQNKCCRQKMCKEKKKKEKWNMKIQEIKATALGQNAINLPENQLTSKINTKKEGPPFIPTPKEKNKI